MMRRTGTIAGVLGVGILLMLNPSASAGCAGDVDGDGDTDLTDLGIFLHAWNSIPGHPNWDPRADLDGDGDVDAPDLGILLADWGCPDDEPGCDGEPSDALQFQVVAVDNSAMQPGDDELAPEFSGGVTHFSFDLQVIVSDDNDWTATQAEAVLSEGGLEFFYHALGDRTPSLAALTLPYPALEFDTMAMTTRSYAGNVPPSADPDTFINGSFGAQAISVDAWFGIPPNGGDGVFTIARYTVMAPPDSGVFPSVVAEGGGGGAPILGTLTGVATSYNTLGDCNEFAFDIVRLCAGDLDHDRDIDQGDLGILLADWGCTFDCVGDVDGDDDVDQADLGVVLANWGNLCGGDCNENGISDWQDLNDGTSQDCNNNWIPDECDIADGRSGDRDGNGIPDECEGPWTLYVDDDAPNDPGPGDPSISDPDEDGSEEHPYDAIQEAIPHTLPGDIVIVADGTYTGVGNKNIDFGRRELLLRSANGPQTCMIDMEGSGRGFSFHSAETRAAQVTGFTITNGRADDGAGIRCTNGSSPTITDCIISANTADRTAGGVYCWYSDPAFIDCIIVGNMAGSNGGGVLCYRGDVVFIDCIIAGNTAGDEGGGIRCRLSDSTFTNCIIAANSAGDEGGGLYCRAAAPAFVNCTFTGNTAPLGGAAYCYAGGSPVFADCILWGDTPQEIYGSGIPQVSYSDIQGGWSGTGNIDADPLFVDPDGPDDDPDTWADNDYRLGPGSPCIDAADNDAVPADEFDLDGDDDTDEPIPFDLDGNPRFVDDPDTDDTGNGTPPIVDIGAYEFQIPGVGDLDGDYDIDQTDLGILLADWGCTGGGCPGDCDGDGDTDQSDLGILLAHWGMTCP